MHEVLQAGFGCRSDDDGRYLVEIADSYKGESTEREVGGTQLSQTRVDRFEVAPACVGELVPNANVGDSKECRRVRPAGNPARWRIIRVPGRTDADSKPSVSGRAVCFWGREAPEVLRRRDTGRGDGKDDERPPGHRRPQAKYQRAKHERLAP